MHKPSSVSLSCEGERKQTLDCGKIWEMVEVHVLLLPGKLTRFPWEEKYAIMSLYSYYNKSSAAAGMGDRLATIDTGQKMWVGAAVPLLVGSWVLI